MNDNNNFNNFDSGNYPQVPQAPQEPSKKRKPHTTAKVAGLLAGVVILTAGAGFGGAYFAERGVSSAILGSFGHSPNENNTNSGSVESNNGGAAHNNNENSTTSKIGTPTLDSMQNSIVSPIHNQASNVEYKSDGSYMYTRDLVAAVRDSIVYITTFAPYNGKETALAAGSGIIISTDGYIVTNEHVVDEGTSFTAKVYTTDPETGIAESETYDAVLCGKDADTDLAVLKIEGRGFHAAKLGDSDELRLGDDVIAIGNPLHFETTVTKGIISGLNRQVSDARRGLTSIQTDTPINSGNSGGALFNTFGEVVGVVNMKRIGTNVESLSFAITINEAKDVIDDLINSGYVTGRAVLGITYQRVSETAALYNGNTAGWQVAEINQSMAVANSGLQIGDTITQIDGISVLDDAVQDIFAQKKPGDYVEVTVARTDTFGRNRSVNISIQLSEYKGE
ncbi:MAG: trypsin-like peptidase domain-containing protein [Oscillospiraceae bacterium]|nr:trypsin-like peptidase domain-containing protein [Oscillospiraceae bacterium]